jgi:transposase
MTKFNLEQKLGAVTRYQNGSESVRDIARSLGANHEIVRMWIKQFEYHGIKAFEKNYTSYTLQFKLDVLNYLYEHGTSPNEAAVIFNISSPTLIRKWRVQLSTFGNDALGQKKKGRPSMKKDLQKQAKKITPAEGSVEALQAEVERLRMENAYLKKLNALVQNKEK